MCFLIQLAPLQVAAQVDKPPIHRTFRKKEIDRYSVVIDSEGGNGTAHYEFELKLFAERPVAESSDTKVEATFLNLKSKFNDMVAPNRKLFGSASYKFPETGFPNDYSLAGQEANFVLPILSWYLPTSAVETGHDFTVPEMVFDGTVHVSGGGILASMDSASATIKLVLMFNMGNQKSEGSKAQDPSFASTATFSVKTGVLETADGTMAGLGGKMSFHVKKI